MLPLNVNSMGKDVYLVCIILINFYAYVHYARIYMYVCDTKLLDVRECTYIRAVNPRHFS